VAPSRGAWWPQGWRGVERRGRRLGLAGPSPTRLAWPAIHGGSCRRADVPPRRFHQHPRPEPAGRAPVGQLVPLAMVVEVAGRRRCGGRRRPASGMLVNPAVGFRPRRLVAHRDGFGGDGDALAVGGVTARLTCSAVPDCVGWGLRWLGGPGRRPTRRGPSSLVVFAPAVGEALSVLRRGRPPRHPGGRHRGTTGCVSATKTRSSDWPTWPEQSCRPPSIRCIEVRACPRRLPVSSDPARGGCGASPPGAGVAGADRSHGCRPGGRPRRQRLHVGGNSRNAAKGTVRQSSTRRQLLGRRTDARSALLRPTLVAKRTIRKESCHRDHPDARLRAPARS
jgi:hypothetical protein